jgi:glutathione S-transferase
MGESIVALIALVALALYVYMSARVGQARIKFNLPAPATTGNPDFERAYRVQMNTLESLPVFLGALYISARYFDPWVTALLGAVWIVGRYLYMEGYAKAAEGRHTGFTVQAIALIGLLACALLGVLWSFF